MTTNIQFLTALTSVKFTVQPPNRRGDTEARPVQTYEATGSEQTKDGLQIMAKITYKNKRGSVVTIERLMSIAILAELACLSVDQNLEEITKPVVEAPVVPAEATSEVPTEEVPTEEVPAADPLAGLSTFNGKNKKKGKQAVTLTDATPEEVAAMEATEA